MCAGYKGFTVTVPAVACSLLHLVKLALYCLSTRSKQELFPASTAAFSLRYTHISRRASYVVVSETQAL